MSNFEVTVSFKNEQGIQNYDFTNTFRDSTAAKICFDTLKEIFIKAGKKIPIHYLRLWKFGKLEEIWRSE